MEGIRSLVSHRESYSKCMREERESHRSANMENDLGYWKVFFYTFGVANNIKLPRIRINII